MATKEQYDFFKDQFAEEEKRYSDLTKRAEIYFTILSLLLTGIIFKTRDLIEILNKLTDVRMKIILVGVFIISFILFGLGFFFIARALKIREFEGVTDVRGYLDTLGETPPVNDDFFDDRIVDFISAIEKNESVNNLRANSLSFALHFILSGFVCLSVFIILLFIQII